MKKVYEDFYRDALAQWGEDAQLRMCIEEMSELTQAICHYIRLTKSGDNDDVRRQLEQAKAHLREETADVLNVVYQVALMCGEEEVERIREEKLRRTVNRLAEWKNQQLRLVLPDASYLASYQEAYDEYMSANTNDEIGFTNPRTTDVLIKALQYRTGVALPQGYVPSTALWLVKGERFLGEINVRHRLNDALNRYGGHIGYTVRLNEQNKGYGTRMLALALAHCRTMGLSRVMLTCNDDNVRSARVIEKNGGQLQDKIPNNINGKQVLTRRYWITL